MTAQHNDNKTHHIRDITHAGCYENRHSGVSVGSSAGVYVCVLPHRNQNCCLVCLVGSGFAITAYKQVLVRGGKHLLVAHVEAHT